MEGFWPIFFLAVILKIPVVALFGIVWWAVRQTPEPEQEEVPDSGEGGPSRRRPRRPRPRGPHGPASLPLTACPPGGRRRLAAPTCSDRASGACAKII